MADTSRHLTYFKVENFKRFESFEMKDLGQFNLIVGDNNVGKTSVLEALLVDEREIFLLNSLARALEFRKIKSPYKIEDLDLFVNKLKSLYSGGEFSINYEWINKSLEPTKLSLIFSVNNLILEIKKEGLIRGSNGNRGNYNFSENIGKFNIPFNFIPFHKGHDTDLLIFYKTLQKSSDKKAKFINSLRLIIPDIFNIEPSVDENVPGLLVFQNNNEAVIPLALFGDGALKLFRLLAEIIINYGNRLMIDEVDTGIYYKRFKEFWKAILLTAKENDVQLFMTTHNEECIKYFKEVLEEELPELQKDVRNITLVENSENKKVTAHTFDYDQFEHAINVGNEIRG